MNQNRTIVYVTYTDQENSFFDKDYYDNHHVPLVIKSWEPFGLEHASAFYPVNNTSGTIVICECIFKDKASVEEAFAAPITEKVMEDVKTFTNINPNRYIIN